jgi:hypothetical protein
MGKTPHRTRPAFRLSWFQFVIRMHQVEIAEPTVFSVQVRLVPENSEHGFLSAGAMDLAARERVRPAGGGATPGTNLSDVIQ